MILHEEGQDGNAIPNLDAPVSTVQAAVANLYKVRKLKISQFLDWIQMEHIESNQSSGSKLHF